MSSGFGVRSTNGRCFLHWTDYKTCVNHVYDPFNECKDLLEDYVECLHRIKQGAWMRKVDEKIIQKRHDLEHGVPVENPTTTKHH